MSSKRKRRHQAWLEREAKRAAKKFAWERFNKAKESNDLETMAAMLGIRLR